MIKATALGGNIKYFGVYLYPYCPDQITLRTDPYNLIPISFVSTYVGANTIGTGIDSVY
jgi:hypothetical protein